MFMLYLFACGFVTVPPPVSGPCRDTVVASIVPQTIVCGWPESTLEISHDENSGHDYYLCRCPKGEEVGVER